MTPQNPNPSPLFCSENPWKTNMNTIWLGSTLTLSRNLEKFKFPSKLATDKRKQLIPLITQHLFNHEQFKHLQLMAAEDVPPIEKEFLVEHFLSHHSFHQAYAGEAFVLDETGEFLAVLNLEDHLLLQFIDVREELEKTWNRLVNIETKLNESIRFAFSPKFGFLTANVMQCGTGFLGYVFLHLPALRYTYRFDEVVNKHQEDGIERTGLQGNPHELIGDIAVFHNNYTLGLTEENILVSLRTLATKLVVEEKSIREHLKQESETEVAAVKDKVSRAYGILMHSYQIDAVEALQALSLVKLGLDLNWLQGISQATVNYLFFACRRAHLLCLYEQKISQEELPHRRAEFIHQTLHELELMV
jgi:protein arginine kinase